MPSCPRREIATFLQDLKEQVSNVGLLIIPRGKNTQAMVRLNMTDSITHCPICGEGATLQPVEQTETFEVRGEAIEVQSIVMQCPQCGEEMLRPEDPDPVDRAFREYRKRHNLLQPEEIRELRGRYQLTQSELSTLLGLGGATLSRWENGSLQEEPHDHLLRFAMEPQNLHKLLQEKPDAIAEGKRLALTRQLDEDVRRYTEEQIHKYRMAG
jgi:putative zinc finger/helix-turn-helix YgiT family protein